MSVIEAFTDGACSGNGTKHSVGGVGVHFPAHPAYDVSEALLQPPKATNNRAELTAVIRALQVCDTINPDRKRGVHIKSDSQLVVNTVTCWMAKWKKAGWTKAGGGAVSNVDLLQTLDAFIANRRVTLTHVRAHTSGKDADSVSNAVADKLARAGVGRLCRGALF
ncbi:TPA: hypothetical protein ACH3X1_005866 [Trebouxia sp. C0004]